MESSSKIENLKEEFALLYGSPPDMVVSSPGRVNLIGEHIDYCGYSVFPIAIEQSILLAVGRNDRSRLDIANLEAFYPSFSCDINNYVIDDDKPLWHKYVLCGIQGIKDILSGEKLFGVNILINGNIPPNAGLSSSSALVCAAALAMTSSHGLQKSKEELADQCAAAERYIGTQGGGMDQAACLLSSKGMAMKINFNPLTMEKTILPKGAAFVVANSLVSANKAATSDFNCRVMECRLAAKIIATKCGLSKDEVHDSSLSKLKNLQERLNKSLDEMIDLVDKYLHTKPYTQEEICTILNVTLDELKNDVLTKNTIAIQLFQLHDRAKHVFLEASRVCEFKRLCDDLSATPDASSEQHKNTLVELGLLMNASHDSTRYLYCCSHPKLDILVELSRKIAYGARLTGAGWGGCIVALVQEEKVNEFMDMLYQQFYASEEAAQGKDKESYLFSTQPGDGATIIQ